MAGKALRSVLVGAVLALALSGCALTEDAVDLAYTPAVAAAPVPGAEAVSVKVTALDGRPNNRDRISVKKNGYGMEMAAIRAKQDVPTLVRQSIERELTDRGFKLGEGPAFVLVDVNRFYADFKTGFWSADSVAEAHLNVQVRGTDGRMLYGKGIAGEGKIGEVMIMGGENARDAMQKALSDAVRRVVTDEFFLQALREAQRPASAAKPMGAPTS
ncbi:MAG TPA: YajG family lipoprotein [Azospirillum sp.]